MSKILDLELLLRAAPVQAVKHLREARQKHDESSVGATLLRAVECETLPASALGLWLSSAQHWSSAVQVLNQDFAASARRDAISFLGKCMAKDFEQWKAIWNELGGVAGLIQLLARLSVVEASFLLKVIGWGYRVNDAAKQDAITELFHTLCSVTVLKKHFPQTRLVNTDERPLLPFYLQLLPSCTEECVRAVIENSNLVRAKGLRYRLLLSHTTLMQDFFRRGYASKIPELQRLTIDMPSTQSERPGFTTPMLFSWSLLSDKSSSISDRDSVLMACSLLKRASQRKLPLEDLYDIFQLAIDVLARCRKQTLAVTTHVNRPVDYTIRWWSSPKQTTQSQPKWDVLLSRMLEATKIEIPSMFVDETKRLMPVERGRRFDLLRFISLHHYDIDLDQDDHLKRAMFRQDLYAMLDQKHAIDFLKRCIKVYLHKRSNDVDYAGFFMAEPVKNAPQWRELSEDRVFRSLEPTLTLAELEGDRNKIQEICAERVESQKKQAERSRDPNDRAKCARLAVSWTLRSGCLQKLQDVVVWSKRFVRDYVTMRTLTAGAALTQNAVELLAVVPKYAKVATTQVDLMKMNGEIYISHAILITLLITLDMARKEPSYNAADWREVRTLFPRIVAARMKSTEQLEKRVKNLTFDQLYNAIWKPTLSCYEEISKHPFWGRDGSKHPESSLILTPQSSTPFNAKRADLSMRFLDDMAKIMDDAWIRYRRLENPAMAVVPEVFPKGLPIQNLLGGADKTIGWTIDNTPFITSKAENIVFMHEELALAAIPSDEEVQDSIGTFVDSFRTAVTIYVGGDRLAVEQQKRLARVYTYWRARFREDAGMPIDRVAARLRRALLPQVVVYPQARHPLNLMFDPDLERHIAAFSNPLPLVCDYPRLPRSSSGSEIFEWNPFESVIRSEVDEPEHSPKAIDCLMQTSTHPVTFQSDFNTVKSQKTVRKTQQVSDIAWSRFHPEQVPRNIEGEVPEALITSAILYLDARLADGSRILDKSYPNVEPVRYPAMYLDSFYIEQCGDRRSNNPVEVLKAYLNRVPPKLLGQVAEKYVKKLSIMSPNAEQFTYVQYTSFELLQLLAKGDMPQLACDLVIRTILSFPDSSSWHRQLLTTGFLRRLSAKHTEYTVNLFAKSITESWQKVRPISTPGTTPAADGKVPRIKVTTVKMLAQLIKGADYVSIPFSVGILSELFKHGTHIDVQAATLDALRQFVLEGDPEREEQVVEQVLQILETAVPIIARFNERDASTDQDWENASLSGTIPPPYDEDSETNAPLAQSLVRDMILPGKYKQVYFERILEPALKMSQENRRKWHRIFLEKVGGDQSLADLAIPFTSDVFGTLLDSYRTYVTMDDARVYYNFRLANVQPSAELVDVNNKIKRQRNLRDSVEGRYWLSELDQGVNRRWYRFQLGMLLTREWEDTKRSDGRGISREDIRHLFMSHATAILDTEKNPETPMFEEFITNPLAPRSSLHDVYDRTKLDSAKHWQREVRPILEEIQNLIESKRTAEWQQALDRTPRFLPPPWHVGRELLPYPFLNDTTPDADIRCQTFARSIYDLLRKVPGLVCSPSFMPLDKIKSIIYKCNAEDVERIANGLGEIETPWKVKDISAAGLYCLLVAEQLIVEWRGSKKGPRWERAETVARIWSESDVNEVRVVGYRTLDRFKVNEGKGSRGNRYFVGRSG